MSHPYRIAPETQVPAHYKHTLKMRLRRIAQKLALRERGTFKKRLVKCPKCGMRLGAVPGLQWSASEEALFIYAKHLSNNKLKFKCEIEVM